MMRNASASSAHLPPPPPPAYNAHYTMKGNAPAPPYSVAVTSATASGTANHLVSGGASKPFQFSASISGMGGSLGDASAHGMSTVTEPLSMSPVGGESGVMSSGSGRLNVPPYNGGGGGGGSKTRTTPATNTNSSSLFSTNGTTNANNNSNSDVTPNPPNPLPMPFFFPQGSAVNPAGGSGTGYPPAGLSTGSEANFFPSAVSSTSAIPTNVPSSDVVAMNLNAYSMMVAAATAAANNAVSSTSNTAALAAYAAAAARAAVAAAAACATANGASLQLSLPPPPQPSTSIMGMPSVMDGFALPPVAQQGGASSVSPFASFPMPTPPYMTPSSSPSQPLSMQQPQMPSTNSVAAAAAALGVADPLARFPPPTSGSAPATSGMAGHQVNGLQYSPHGLYEGYVKRYNPVRGFGFLTATHQLVSQATNDKKTPSESGDNAVSSSSLSSSSAPALAVAAASGVTQYSTSPIPPAPHHSQPSHPGSVGDQSNDGEAEKGAHHHHYASATVHTAGGETNKHTDSSDKETEMRYVRVPLYVGDIFVHQSYVNMHGFRSLPVGGRVRFRVGFLNGQRSFQAVNVELLPQVLPPSMVREREEYQQQQQQQAKTTTTTTAVATPPLNTFHMLSGEVHEVSMDPGLLFDAQLARGEGGPVVMLPLGEGEPLIELSEELLASLNTDEE